MSDANFSVLAEIEASEYFEDESVNWKYCTIYATFKHKEACEFIIHVGDEEHRKFVIEEMLAWGCTHDFVNAFMDAASSGATRVLFYV